MEELINDNVTHSECISEFKSGKTLKYRIVQIKRHIREMDVKSQLIWVDKFEYFAQEIVRKGLFGRKWETISFSDDYTSLGNPITYFEDKDELIHWLKSRDGKRLKVVNLFSQDVE